MMAGPRRMFAGAALTLGLLGCAGTPTAPTPAPTRAAAVAPDAATAQPAAEQSANPFAGYTRRQARNGETLYCREDGVAGTRIPKLVCATEDVMRNQSTEARQQVDDIRQTAGAGGCNPAAGC